MRCIFCKADSTGSVSVEHVIPESLGNKSHVLPAGVVCDGCNNYFAAKVEKPILESPYFKALRLCEAVPSKRGRFPFVDGLVGPGAPVKLGLDKAGGKHLILSDNLEEARSALRFLSRPRSMVVFPAEPAMPNERLFSRFIAKCGLEAMALRVAEHPGGVEYLVTEVQLDPVRHYARRGDRGPTWPVNARRIYHQNQPHSSSTGPLQQVLFEFDLLYTDSNELYFVLAIFGVEFVLNMGGPELDGYLAWVRTHGGRSPLYPEGGPVL